MIIYIWGYNPPAPHRIGNATRKPDIDYHDQANDAARNVDFDVLMLNQDGKPSWATVYETPDGERFEPGDDVGKFEGYADATGETETEEV